MNYFLQEYYDSYNPKSYRRTKDFLYSAVKVEPKIKGNKVIASVYIDTDSMNNYYNATGHQVATWANQRLHGGLYTGGATKKAAYQAVDAFIETLMDYQGEGEKVMLMGFGRFEMKTAKERTGRKPKTGDECIIPEHKRVKFTASESLADRIENNQ